MARGLGHDRSSDRSAGGPGSAGSTTGESGRRRRRGQIRTTVEQRNGQPVLVKRADDADGHTALAHEARMLTLARHPGVVELLEVIDQHEHGEHDIELVLRFVSSHTLTAATCTSPAHAAGIVAAVAEAVADLHQLGIVHGRIEPAHVVLSTEGHPLLVGFREATVGTALRPAGPPAGAPPIGVGSGGVPQRHDDVAALGRLLRDLVVGQPDGPLIPERRWRRGRVDAHDRRALLTLADHATADDPRARPGARRFAAGILTAVPHATLGVPPALGPRATGRFEPADDGQAPPSPSAEPAGHALDGTAGDEPATAGREPDRSAIPPPAQALMDRPRDHPRRARRGVPYAVGLLGLTSVVLGGASLQHADRPELRTDRDLAPSGAAQDRSAATAAPGADAGPPGPTSPGSSPARAATPDPTPPAPPLRFQPAGILTHDGHRYTVGAPGDQVAVGALTCRSTEPDRVAVLRVTTGEIFVFDGWADHDRAREAPMVARVEPGSHWLDPGGPSCTALAVVRPDNTTRIVDLPAKGSP